MFVKLGCTSFSFLTSEVIAYFGAKIFPADIPANIEPEVVAGLDGTAGIGNFYGSFGLGLSLKRFYASFFRSGGRLKILSAGFSVNFTSTLSANLKSGLIELFDSCESSISEEISRGFP
jgi:hypothetical protein